VLGSLKGDASVFAMTKRIYQIVSAMPLADGTRITFGSTSLARRAEKYEAKSSAHRQIRREARKSLGSASLADIEGLENAVSVMQLNDWEVLLFINYRMRVQNRACSWSRRKGRQRNKQNMSPKITVAFIAVVLLTAVLRWAGNSAPFRDGWLGRAPAIQSDRT
jgi:hypothetical protein